MHIYVTIAAAAILLAGCAAIPSSNPSAVASDDPVAGTEEAPVMIGNQRADRLICTNVPVVGTRLPNRRTCRTAEEWQRISDSGKEEVDRVQRGSLPDAVQNGN
jgi:hypothetical protein